MSCEFIEILDCPPLCIICIFVNHIDAALVYCIDPTDGAVYFGNGTGVKGNLASVNTVASINILETHWWPIYYYHGCKLYLKIDIKQTIKLLCLHLQIQKRPINGAKSMSSSS